MFVCLGGGNYVNIKSTKGGNGSSQHGSGMILCLFRKKNRILTKHLFSVLLHDIQKGGWRFLNIKYPTHMKKSWRLPKISIQEYKLRCYMLGVLAP